MSHIEEKQIVKEPERTSYAIAKLTELGFQVETVDPHTLRIVFKGFPVTIYPYSGWFTGKTVNDGRGIANLLKQLKK